VNRFKRWWLVFWLRLRGWRGPRYSVDISDDGTYVVMAMHKMGRVYVVDMGWK
jgi:hypothetical protein